MVTFDRTGILWHCEEPSMTDEHGPMNHFGILKSFRKIENIDQFV